MTFGELCKQTCRECGVGVTYKQMQMILATQWRMMIEELYLNKNNGIVKLDGIGRFYFIKREFNCIVDRDGDKLIYEKKWGYMIKFKPSTLLKRALSDKMPMEDLKIGTFPLYFEKSEIKKGHKDFDSGKQQYGLYLRKRPALDRKELREAKKQKKKSDISKRLPED